MTLPENLSEEQRLCLAFAEAMVKPGGNAMLIDEENRKRGWTWIPTAVASNEAFLIEAHAYLIALDLDERPEDHAWAARVRHGLAQRGCRFIMVNSGREEHLHMWVLLPPGWTVDHARTVMEQIAGPARRWNDTRQAVRPPFAPHRKVGRSKLVEPDAETALKWLHDVRPQGIPDLARAALQWLDPDALVVNRHGELQRGVTIRRAAVSMANQRCSQDDLKALLEGNRNLVTSKYHEKSALEQDDWLRRTWADACRWVRENPAVPVNREVIEKLRAQMPGLEWASGQRGCTDRCVYRALLQIADEAAAVEVDASIRRLAETANIGPSGVQTALGRLLTAGYIERVDAGNKASADACSYRLVADLPTKSFVSAHTWPYYGGPMAMCAGRQKILSDIFTYGSGLGPGRMETWAALPEAPTKAKDVGQLHPYRPAHTTLLSHLRELHRVGLAGKGGHKWWRIEPPTEDLERLARTLGVMNKGARRASRYERERKAHREWLGQAPRHPYPAT